MEVGFRSGTVLLEKYRVESELGRGGMGIVLRVTHLHLGEELAIKILSPDAGSGPGVHARFLREAQSAVRLRGEHVTRVVDVGVLPGSAPYIVMEYLRGADLSGELARRGALSPGEAVDHVLQACEALAEAHALGIVHRDIKPGNLFLTCRPDGSPLLKVLDFGISKALVGGLEVLTRTDAMMGTPGYMSPEQMMASKDVDARSDIWALGVVLYECLHGHRPFDAETFAATVLRAVSEPPPPMDPRIPHELQTVILRCLEKDAAARFPSIAALAAALAPFARDTRSAGIIVERCAVMLGGLGVSAAPPTHLGESPEVTTLGNSVGMIRVRSMRRYAIGGAALVLAAIVALSIVGLTASPEGGGGTGHPGSRPVAMLLVAGSQGPAGTDPMAHGPGSVPDAAEPVVTVDKALAPTVPQPTAEAPAGSELAASDLTAKAQQCTRLELGRAWKDLKDCADELAALGAHDRDAAVKVREFRQTASKEMANSLAANKFREAIAEGNLREAQRLLKSIRSDSVYFSALHEAFHAAEAHAVDETRRTAQMLVATDDCAGVRRLQSVVGTISTTAVSGAVAAVAARCVDGTPSRTADPGAAGDRAAASTDPAAR